jgi:hypothetical protein
MAAMAVMTRAHAARMAVDCAIRASRMMRSFIAEKSAGNVRLLGASTWIRLLVYIVGLQALR